MAKEKVLISACLLGVNCRYDGKSTLNAKIQKYIQKYDLIPICPEQLGGFSTPRIAAEIKNIDGVKKVININQKDVTELFNKGAEEVLKIARLLNIKKAILKSKSPSCGFGKIYDGSFSGKLINGNGILTDMLINNDIEIINSDNL